jgi:hypothetical protein
VQVVGLAYDKSSHKLELTVRNTGDERYSIKSALRLIQPAADVIKEATSSGNIPMAHAKASLGNRRLFQLLCEDDSPVALEPNETRTLTYDLLVPAEHVKLDSTKNVEVHISYGQDADNSVVQELSRNDGADGFSIKLGSGEVIAEAFLVEDLLEALRNSPDDAIRYHLNNGNDFAQWVANVVGDTQLASQLSSISYTTADETKKRLTSVLEDKVESLKHPFLRKVSDDRKFVLKSDHNEVVSEISLLEDLAEKLANSSPGVVSFHMREGNDFASWIGNAIGDTELAAKLSSISHTDSEETRNRVVSTIRERVDYLKCEK